MITIQKIYEDIGAEFVTPIHELTKKFADIKAFVFDWDGVFNTGEKNGNGSSSFSEIDAMGVNMLRFSYFLKNKQPPLTALISGEKNESAFYFAKREYFNASYFKIAHKKWALDHFCNLYNIQPHQICYFFDDVLDLVIAKEAGIRVLVARKASTLFTNYAKQNNLADYITAHPSGNFAIREACEMLMGISGLFNETITHRMNYDAQYQEFLAKKNGNTTHFYTYHNQQIVAADSKL
ncbi:MAG: phosphatase [Bacteroidia bacterium]